MWTGECGELEEVTVTAGSFLFYSLRLALVLLLLVVQW